jgi:hypothetical protein
LDAEKGKESEQQFVFRNERFWSADEEDYRDSL